MKVKNVAINSITPYKDNPRKIDGDAIEKVANSIKEFGFEQPIVVDKNNTVIVGHTRLLAAKKLKLKQVPIVVADKLTPEQVTAYRLADNKTGELSDWDYTALEHELDNVTGLDMTSFGFEDSEFSADGDLDDYIEPEEKPEQAYECPHCHGIIKKSELIKLDSDGN